VRAREREKRVGNKPSRYLARGRERERERARERERKKREEGKQRKGETER